MTSQFQPPPTYAEVVIVDPTNRQPPRFNPIWLKWFLDLTKGVSAGGAGGGGSGTVTSVGSGTGLTGGPITGSGSLALDIPVMAPNGGTGQTSYAIGDLLYASTTTALSKLADVATGNALISGGVGVAPTWGKIGLGTHVSGTLTVPNGGTGAGTFAAGDILFGNGTSAIAVDANLTWSATTGLLTQKGISSKGAANGVGTELFGLGASDACTLATTNNTIIGANARQLGNNGFEDNNVIIGTNAFISSAEFNVLIGAGSSISSVFSSGHTVVGQGISVSGAGISNSVFGKGNSLSGASLSSVFGNTNVVNPSAPFIGVFGSGNNYTHGYGGLFGVDLSSYRNGEIGFGFGDNVIGQGMGCSFTGTTAAFTPREMFRSTGTWIDATDATRKARVTHFVKDTADREYMRADANGSGVDLYLNANTSPLSAAGFSLGTAALPWQQLFVDFTNTATVGSVTINKASGTVNMAALGSTLTVTDSLVTANSRIMATLASDPGVALSIWCVGGAGSFTVNTRPAVVNQTAIDFIVFP